MAKHGYEQVDIDEVRRVANEDYGIVPGDIEGKTKLELIKLIKDAEEDARVANVFDAAEEEVEPEPVITGGGTHIVEEKDTPQPYMPAFGSDGWAEFLQRQFKDEEMSEGGPTHDGCKRLVETFVGPIVSSTIPSNTTPDDHNNGTATVVVRVEVEVKNEDHPLYGRVICMEEIADVNKFNTDEPYCRHASNTAATIARGRAFRLLLGLHGFHTAEEMSEAADSSEPEWQVDEPITDTQITVLNTMCHRLDINVLKFVRSGKQYYDKIEDVTKSTANNMIKELNKFQRDIKQTPDNIKGYQSDWRGRVNESSG